jgi:hypothetical protein
MAKGRITNVVSEARELHKVRVEELPERQSLDEVVFADDRSCNPCNFYGVRESSPTKASRAGPSNLCLAPKSSECFRKRKPVEIHLEKAPIGHFALISRLATERFSSPSFRGLDNATAIFVRVEIIIEKNNRCSNCLIFESDYASFFKGGGAGMYTASITVTIVGCACGKAGFDDINIEASGLTSAKVFEPGWEGSREFLFW